MSKNVLMGFARKDITPTESVPLRGYGNTSRRMSGPVIDPQYTTCMAFSDGDTTTITVFRAGQELELSITFDERPQDVNADNNDTVAPGEMPSSGSFDEWYDYFFRGFGGNGNG